ncbi:MAG TPA: hypothetical protein DCW29_18830 [Janthinobacterium sp.]|nr:hypothetical protein [Janthinobacterium sp.]
MTVLKTNFLSISLLSIKLTSKQANLENAFYASVTAGSGRQKRVAADWNKVIDSDGGSAFRVNLLDQDSGNPQL